MKKFFYILVFLNFIPNNSFSQNLECVDYYDQTTVEFDHKRGRKPAPSYKQSYEIYEKIVKGKEKMYAICKDKDGFNKFGLYVTDGNMYFVERDGKKALSYVSKDYVYAVNLHEYGSGKFTHIYTFGGKDFFLTSTGKLLYTPKDKVDRIKSLSSNLFSVEDRMYNEDGTTIIDSIGNIISTYCWPKNHPNGEFCLAFSRGTNKKCGVVNNSTGEIVIPFCLDKEGVRLTNKKDTIIISGGEYNLKKNKFSQKDGQLYLNDALFDPSTSNVVKVGIFAAKPNKYCQEKFPEITKNFIINSKEFGKSGGLLYYIEIDSIAMQYNLKSSQGYQNITRYPDQGLDIVTQNNKVGALVYGSPHREIAPCKYDAANYDVTISSKYGGTTRIYKFKFGEITHAYSIYGSSGGLVSNDNYKKSQQVYSGARTLVFDGGKGIIVTDNNKQFDIDMSNYDTEVHRVLSTINPLDVDHEFGEEMVNYIKSDRYKKMEGIATIEEVKSNKSEEKKNTSSIPTKTYLWVRVMKMTYPTEMYNVDYAEVIAPAGSSQGTIIAAVSGKPKVRVGFIGVSEEVFECESNGCGVQLDSYAKKYKVSAVNCGYYKVK